MHKMASIACLCLLLAFSTIVANAINHWVLKDSKIVQKVDSPFHMRQPDNLIAFLVQIRYNDYVERSYLELLRKREQIADQLRFTSRFGEDLVEQAKCAMDYYMLEKRMSYLKIPELLKRINLPEQSDRTLTQADRMAEPVCERFYELKVGPASYAHLESFQPHAMNTPFVESEIDAHIGTATVEIIRRYAMDGLRRFPNSWKFHTLSSYYWRMLGNALQALPCARIAAMLAPVSHKDIPLLSLGTILFRMGNLADADMILTAAVEHAYGIADNHFVLGAALAMKHDFNRSLHHFDEAERLDASTLPRTQQVRNFITCLENLTKKTSKMYSYGEYMKNEVKEFKKLKHQISVNLERLIQQQLPLGARFLDSKEGNDDLHRRGQFCSTRTPNGSDEPVLFCDFFSDMQIRLESKDVDIDSIERDLLANTDAVIRQVSSKIRKQISLEQMKSLKAHKPAGNTNGKKLKSN